jgi:steroid delta-isomerase-like uncharacterized protein
MRATTIAAACLLLLAESSFGQSVPATPRPPTQTATQISRSGKSLLQAYVSAWNRHDFAALETLLTPDSVHEDIAWGFRSQGPAQIKDSLRMMIESEPDMDWRLTTIIGTGPIVAAEWTWTATFTGDTPVGHFVRKRVSTRGVSVVVTENGRIKRFTDYYDMASTFAKAPTDTPASKK